jgi:hypothetical protein
MSSVPPAQGIPTAKGFLPPGSPAETYITHNRACKVALIAIGARSLGYGPGLTDQQIDEAADAIGAYRPNSAATRRGVREALERPVTLDDDEGDAVRALFTALANRRPLPATAPDGRTYLMVPILLDR